jgi:hypothetical protein
MFADFLTKKMAPESESTEISGFFCDGQRDRKEKK